MTERFANIFPGTCNLLTAVNRCKSRGSILLLLVLLTCAALPGWAQTPGKTFGGTDNEQGFSVTVLSDGNYAVVGRTRSAGEGSQ